MPRSPGWRLTRPRRGTSGEPSQSRRWSPSPTSHQVLLGSWSWEFTQHASCCQIRKETEISQVKFPFRPWWSYWRSVDINYTGISLDAASFSLCCTVFIIAAAFPGVISLKVKFSSAGIVSDMKLVRTNLDTPLYSRIIQFPNPIRKMDKEKSNIPLTIKYICEASLYSICIKQKEYNPGEKEKFPLFIPSTIAFWKIITEFSL